MGLEPSVRGSTLSNMNISETSRRMVIKFHLEHHWGKGLAALGFGQDQIRTLVSMATYRSHRDMIGLWCGKSCDHSNSFILIGSSLFLQDMRTTILSRMSSKFGRIRLGIYELAPLGVLEKSPFTFNGRIVVTTLVPSFLDWSSSFLQVTRQTITACMSLNSARYHHWLRSKLPLSVWK